MWNRRVMDYEIREVIRNGIKYTYKWFPQTKTAVLIKSEPVE